MLASFWLAIIVAWAVTPWIASKAMQCKAVAVPRQRDVHDVATPRWGGAAIALSVLISAGVAVTIRHLVTHGASGWSHALVGVFVATAFVCVVGMLDDRYEVSAWAQIGGLLAAAVVLIAFDVRIDGISQFNVAQSGATYNPARWLQLSTPLSVLLTVAWVGVVAKTVDAMDGLDGLAGGICAISAATLTLIGASSKVADGPSIALVGAAIVGACVGFLRFNIAPARIFMGSSGGLFLGVMLAALSMLGSFKIATAWSLVIGVLVLGVPIFDYLLVLLQRLRDNAPLHAADRRHLHHRLLDRGLSKRQAVLYIYCCTAMLCTLALVLFSLGK